VKRAPVIAALFALLMPFGAAGAGETQVTANGFPATLSWPDGVPAAPVVLFIAGSGPTDRNGNSLVGVRAGYLARLARSLSDRGVASLRFDKRGLPGSLPVAREEDVTLDTFVDDAGAVFDWLSAQPAVEAVFLLGHSEGGLIALDLATRRPGLAGLVLVATPGLPPAETLRAQMQALPEPARSRALEILAEIEAGKAVEDVPQDLAGLFRPSVQPFLGSLLSRRPAQAFAGLRQPALLIGGGTDLQVGRADFDALRAARADAETLWLGRMNHVLTDAPPDRAGNLATYSDPGAMLSDGLATAVAGFVERTQRRSTP
jgi:pimeloyl-ACP methyl ester carboxylesterase